MHNFYNSVRVIATTNPIELVENKNLSLTLSFSSDENSIENNQKKIGT